MPTISEITIQLIQVFKQVFKKQIKACTMGGKLCNNFVRFLVVQKRVGIKLFVNNYINCIKTQICDLAFLNLLFRNDRLSQPKGLNGLQNRI